MKEMLSKIRKRLKLPGQHRIAGAGKKKLLAILAAVVIVVGVFWISTGDRCKK